MHRAVLPGTHAKSFNNFGWLLLQLDSNDRRRKVQVSFAVVVVKAPPSEREGIVDALQMGRLADAGKECVLYIRLVYHLAFLGFEE